MHCTRSCTPYVLTSAIVYWNTSWLLFRAPLWGVVLSLGMADVASSAEDSLDDDSNLSHTCTTTGHRKRPDDDSDLGRTRTATGQKKRSLSQTAAQREEQLVIERLQHILFFITSSYYTCTLPYTSFSLLYVFTLSPYSLLLLIYQIHKLLHDWGARHVLCAMRMPSIIRETWPWTLATKVIFLAKCLCGQNVLSFHLVLLYMIWANLCWWIHAQTHWKYDIIRCT